MTNRSTTPVFTQFLLEPKKCKNHRKNACPQTEYLQRLFALSNDLDYWYICRLTNWLLCKAALAALIVFPQVNKLIRALVHPESGPPGLAWVDTGYVAASQQTGRGIQADVRAAGNQRFVQRESYHAAIHSYHTCTGYADAGKRPLYDARHNVRCGIERRNNIGRAGYPIRVIPVLHRRGHRQRQQLGTMCVGNLHAAAHHLDPALDGRCRDRAQ